MIERTEEDEYREWKNRLASEYLETADMTPRTALRMQANSVTQNLFGNEYLEAYVHNDGRFTMGTRGYPIYPLTTIKSYCMDILIRGLLPRQLGLMVIIIPLRLMDRPVLMLKVLRQYP